MLIERDRWIVRHIDRFRLIAEFAVERTSTFEVAIPPRYLNQLPQVRGRLPIPLTIVGRGPARDVRVRDASGADVPILLRAEERALINLAVMEPAVAQLVSLIEASTNRQVAATVRTLNKSGVSLSDAIRRLNEAYLDPEVVHLSYHLRRLRSQTRTLRRQVWSPRQAWNNKRLIVPLIDPNDCTDAVGESASELTTVLTVTRTEAMLPTRARWRDPSGREARTTNSPSVSRSWRSGPARSLIVSDGSAITSHRFDDEEAEEVYVSTVRGAGWHVRYWVPDGHSPFRAIRGAEFPKLPCRGSGACRNLHRHRDASRLSETAQ